MHSFKKRERERERAFRTLLRPKWTNFDQDELVKQLTSSCQLHVNSVFGATRPLQNHLNRSAEVHIGDFISESLRIQRRVSPVPDVGRAHGFLVAEEEEMLRGPSFFSKSLFPL